MKFAFSTLACPQWSVEEIVHNALEMGYDGVEWRLIDGEVINPVTDADKLRDAVELCRERGLEVCAFDTSCRLNQSDPHQLAQQVHELRTWIALAEELHVPILRVFGGEPPAEAQSNPEAENTIVVKALHQVSHQAETAGVTIAIETHDAFSSAQRVAAILKETNSPAVAALWDSHHPYRVGETVNEVLQALDGSIVHVHVKDAFKVPDSDNWQLVLVGEGEVPVQEQIQRLYEHGYKGYISVEWEKRWHLELSNPEIALPEHIAWLKRVEKSLVEV
ncbi:sugar phosphate isomerase/epimerase family protein [Tengunoibacter tsumagoiensis]|uniref:Sugar phosphate isomerase n=1 Tax=Tengunoibacter tsumagoiensis TaxID=2014871 RepID=A0A402A6C1_9CHLR|nr:sugar phosphate isomerase/epimerase family protein [Tengunoibacter tsumagoiensis]GCE14697.1 sugar phosphate isomerase [Tengunoibacter tsumagoiensis]